MKKLTIILLAFLILAAAVPVSAEEEKCVCPPGLVCLKNPLCKRGINEPADLVLQVIQAFAGIMGAVAIAFIVFSGFKMIVSTDEESIKNARAGVTWSVLGFALSILSFSVIAASAKLLGYDPANFGGYDRIFNPIGDVAGKRSDFISVMNFVMINFLGLLGFAATLMILYYGYKYMTAFGSEEKIEEAKVGLRWTLLGLVIVLLAFTVITSVRKYLLFGV